MDHAKQGKEDWILNSDGDGVFPHCFSAKNVVHLLALRAGAGRYLFHDLEFVGTGAARPVTEPGWQR